MLSRVDSLVAGVRSRSRVWRSLRFLSVSEAIIYIKIYGMQQLDNTYRAEENLTILAIGMLLL